MFRSHFLPHPIHTCARRPLSNEHNCITSTDEDMSSETPAKRRRLNNAANTLSKPFRSPLKTPSTAQTAPLAPNRNAANTLSRPYRPSTLAHTILSSPQSSPPQKTQAALLPPKTPLPKRTPLRVSYTPYSARTLIDPAVSATQKSVSALEARVRSLRNEIDSLTQAAQISSSTTDAELEALIEKWRICAQSCAEEVFGHVKEKVNRMGGVGAWRDAERSKFDRFKEMDEMARKEEEAKEDEVDEFDEDGIELPEEEIEARRAEVRRVRQEKRDAMDEAEPVEENEGEESDKKVWMEEGRDDDVSNGIAESSVPDATY